MQVAQGQILIRVSALVLSTIGWCILLLPVPKMVLTLCNSRWWCFCYHHLAQKHNIHYIVVAITCNLRWWCFWYANLPMYWCAQAHTSTHCNITCTVWWCYWFVVVVVYSVYICVCVCVRRVCLWCWCRVIYVCLCICMYVHEAGKGKLNTTHQQEKDGMCVPIC